MDRCSAHYFRGVKPGCQISVQIWVDRSGKSDHEFLAVKPGCQISFHLGGSMIRSLFSCRETIYSVKHTVIETRKSDEFQKFSKKKLHSQDKFHGVRETSEKKVGGTVGGDHKSSVCEGHPHLIRNVHVGRGVGTEEGPQRDLLKYYVIAYPIFSLTVTT